MSNETSPFDLYLGYCITWGPTLALIAVVITVMVGCVQRVYARNCAYT